ncbi:hypothetical protein F2P56_032380 [Juglans regia]|uniref:Protein OCTOPUS-like n=2 Tax=Juglans regia TaxID=51240 RepID=A0A833TH27_JUGRE|nr:protein OCTOPUS-like isoform X1 [Juglans regia]KAF5446777.1 hypothetical protein F2P56_032380 [Juglans regia]
MSSQPRCRLSSCHRHPTRPVTGFCASCLRERLASIDPATRHEIPTTSAAAVLRRSKSFSAEGSSAAASEPPRRRSCDVRARSTLWDLFNVDDERKGLNRRFEVELGGLGFELREEDENENENESENENENESENDDVEEIRASEDVIPDISNEPENGIVEEGIEFKTMKEFIDLEWRSKKSGGKDFKDIAASFCEAASVFSKKLRKWRQKQKIKKHNTGNGGGIVEAEEQSGRRCRETQSEIGEYRFGRRSCDTDPRLSVDVARYSFDEPRASWDGYFIGKAYPRLTRMVSVEERVNLGNEEEEEERSPGGSAQTKDYYSETPFSQRRRRSFDRSNSQRRGGITEFDELKLTSNANAKVSPESTELFYGAKLLVAEQDDSRDRNSKCVKDVSLENVESVSKDAATSAAGGINQKGLKKLNKWHRMRNIFGLKQRQSKSKCGDEEGEYVGGNVVDRQLGESWQKLRRVANGEANGSVSQKLIRSYSVSCRNSCKVAGLFSNSGGAEAKISGLKRREEVMLQHSRSARYSPNNLDNGLLRFYLTPLRSYRRSKSGKTGICETFNDVISALDVFEVTDGSWFGM